MINMLLATVVGKSEVITNAVKAAEKGGSIAGWAIAGGIMMIPIFVASILAVAIIIERFVYLKRLRFDTETFMEKIKRVLSAGRIMEALAICENSPGPIPNLIKAGIENRNQSKEDIKEAIEDAATRELPALERFLNALGTIANISPLMGLLGTVMGMIKSTNVLAVEGTSNTIGLIGGISEALITTAAGLLVAIPVLVSYNYFTNRVNNLILEMEIRSSEVVRLLTSTDKDGGSSEKWEKI